MPLTLLHIRGPQGKVVTEKLHDKGRVPRDQRFSPAIMRHSLVGLLRKGVELGDGIVEGLLGEVASTVGAVQDLVADR